MRLLLKLSGEALSGDRGVGLDSEMMHLVSDIVKELTEKWHQVGIVVGAGNFIRGAEVHEIDRSVADNMGMLAININALALFDYLSKKWIPTEILNSFAVDGVAERFNKNKAMKFMENGGVVIFGGGTWNPYFTTDTAGVLRALETEADLLIKATKVDGLYTKDPKKYDDAEFIKEISFDEVVKNNYKVMDMTAIILAKENKLDIKIVNLFKKWAVVTAVEGSEEGSFVHNT